MTAALFGKLPAKRDFVSRRMPHAFLSVFEPWLHEALAVSREALGPRWSECYLSAPIWRFWFPPALCGAGAMGALMPSVDGIGRYFPLMIASVAPPGEGYGHPAYDQHAGWFDAVEGILLGALDEGATLEVLLTWLGRLREPALGAPDQLMAPADRLTAGAAPLPAALGPGLHRLKRPPPFASRTTAWWTTGGEHYPATALAWPGLPPNSFFATMLARNAGAVSSAGDAA